MGLEEEFCEDAVEGEGSKWAKNGSNRHELETVADHEEADFSGLRSEGHADPLDLFQRLQLLARFLFHCCVEAVAVRIHGYDGGEAVYF